MRRRAVVLAIGAIASLSSLAGTATALAEPPTAADADAAFSAAPGQYVALHFIPDGAAARAPVFIQATTDNADTLAGVRHFFIVGGDASWTDTLGSHARHIRRDADGSLAASRSVQGAAPVTIVTGEGGREVARISGGSVDDFPSWKTIAAQVASATKSAALSDYNLPKGSSLAVEGYDVVAYFTQKKAVKGNPALASSYHGVTYHFSSADSRRAFAEDPARYLPTYGGWCASAMGAKAEKVEIDPKNFSVEHGRLFLFYKDIFSDAKKDWNKHRAAWEPAADTNWKKLTGESPVIPSNEPSR